MVDEEFTRKQAMTFDNWLFSFFQTMQTICLTPYHKLDKTQDTIYHYTSELGFQGIMDSKYFYASHYKYLNDNEELQNVNRILIKELAKYPKKYRTFISKPDELFRDSDYFITSFALLGDSLNHWRYYTKGNGISIGFNRHRLLNIIKTFPLPTTFGFCVYDDKLKSEILNKILGDIYGFYNESVQSLTMVDETLSLLKKRFDGILSILGCMSKHKGFEDEREFRIIITVPKHWNLSIQKRLGQFGQTPYVSFPFQNSDGKFIVDEIFIGPNNKTKIKTIKTYLRKKSVKVLNIRNSKLPYRE